MFARIKTRILFELNRLFRPSMYTLKSNNGRRLNDTRISNTSYIGCIKQLNIADNVFIGHYNFIDACNGITIEEGCQITNYISILTHSSHIAIRLYGKEYTNTKDKIAYNEGSVEIGKYTFVGPHSTIMPGTKIGAGSIIAAYSYVKGEFPDFSIISGNPAIVVGDTRNLDDAYLKEHPELKLTYFSV